MKTKRKRGDVLRELLAITPEEVSAILRPNPFELATVAALGPLKSLV